MPTLYTKVALLSTAALLLLALVACTTNADQNTQNQSQTAHREGLLGTVVSITIYGYEGDADTIFNDAFTVIEDIDQRMSANREGSEIVQLIESYPNPQNVSEDTYSLLSRALYWSEYTSGAFDVTIGAVSSLWRDNGDFIILPNPIDIQEQLQTVGHEKVTLEREGHSVLLAEGTQVDLGSIAKGHALDAVTELLIERSVAHALLDFGGDIHVIGQRPEGSDWRIGIQSPHIGDNDLAAIVTLSDLSVMTTGGYERFFEQDSIIYHHILDPQTGYPAQSGLLSVTVIAQSSTDADALSTAGFVLGLEKGMNLIEELENFEGIFITEDNVIHITTGLQDTVDVNNPNFSLSQGR